MNQLELAPLPIHSSVAILMATYNGEQYLLGQLQSFAAQTMGSWSLFASDDGSSDRTKELLNSFAHQLPDHAIRIFDGPRKGFAKNFLSLVCNSDIQAKFFAYADQDDIWVEDKLSRAVEWLEAIPEKIPALYCSRTNYVDEALNHIAFSLNYDRPAIFANALVQNIASGNTMVFNQAARKLIQAAGKEADIPLHDWWTYMLVTGADGVVKFDSKPTVFYRQHCGNLWGMNAGWKANINRIKKLFEGRFQDWNKRHINALLTVSNLLTVDARKKINLFSESRNESSPLQRLIKLRRSGVYRQTTWTNLGLMTAALLGKI
jgi:glycosyltransferase involved in cell wall biosynthesis